MSTAATSRIARRECISRIAASSSPTRSMRWSRSRTASSSTRRCICARLHRSLAALGIAAPMSDARARPVLREVVRRNGVGEGIVYLQVTRGTAPRDFAFPAARAPEPRRHRASQDAGRSARRRRRGAASSPFPTSAGRGPTSSRCRCCPTCSASSRRRRQGAFEAWQIDRDGNVTEGTSSNAWIVTAAGEVVTRQADRGILNGVTRQGLLRPHRAASG